MRVKIKFPQQSPLAILQVPVRISDINYGGHLGNDAILSVMHEARMQWLGSAGYTELDIAGQGLIMADVMIAYRGESFYGDTLRIELFADDISDRAFNLLYRIHAGRHGGQVLIAEAKTGMICFDYTARKIVMMNSVLKALLQS